MITEAFGYIKLSNGVVFDMLGDSFTVSDSPPMAIAGLVHALEQHAECAIIDIWEDSVSTVLSAITRQIELESGDDELKDTLPEEACCIFKLTTGELVLTRSEQLYQLTLNGKRLIVPSAGALLALLCVINSGRI